MFSIFKAFCKLFGARCEYLRVMVRLLCPNSFDTVGMSTPAITRCDARVCLYLGFVTHVSSRLAISGSPGRFQR